MAVNDEVDGVCDVVKEGERFLGLGLGGGKRKMESTGVDRLRVSFWVRRKKDKEDDKQ